MTYEVIIVGGGAAGLTAAAHLAKAGHKILVLEKGANCGGLVTSFSREGFTFDGGIRALENAGVLFPMLKKLGIDLPVIKNEVSIGIEDQVMHVKGEKDFTAYENLLKNFYPESTQAITAIMQDIQKITRLMDIQYGIDNPLFLDFKEDRDYFIKEVFPWMLKYALSVAKVSSKNKPVVPYLQKFTNNQSLIDVITQHFFTDTPAYFALSYFTLFQEYYYPVNGTGDFIHKLVEFILEHGGEIRTGAAVTSFDLDQRTVKVTDGQVLNYHQLLWAADQKSLYRLVDTKTIKSRETREAIREKQALLSDKVGNDSVLTLYLMANLDPGFFKDISNAHFFYTPSREGLSQAGKAPLMGTWDELSAWLKQFLGLTTYEISIPVLRNSHLAPPGKTGLIVSTLFDYSVTRNFYDHGWENAFLAQVREQIIEVLDATVYPGLAKSITGSFTATPVSIQNRTGSTHGAITGWSFQNDPVPAESRLVRIANAVKTPLPEVFQAGHWTYSPSGFPVALITGKLAADSIHKRLT